LPNKYNGGRKKRRKGRTGWIRRKRKKRTGRGRRREEKDSGKCFENNLIDCSELSYVYRNIPGYVFSQAFLVQSSLETRTLGKMTSSLLYYSHTQFL
jgi:hypothetical protein